MSLNKTALQNSIESAYQTYNTAIRDVVRDQLFWYISNIKKSTDADSDHAVLTVAQSIANAVTGDLNGVLAIKCVRAFVPTCSADLVPEGVQLVAAEGDTFNSIGNSVSVTAPSGGKSVADMMSDLATAAATAFTRWNLTAKTGTINGQASTHYLEFQAKVGGTAANTYGASVAWINLVGASGDLAVLPSRVTPKTDAVYGYDTLGANRYDGAALTSLSASIADAVDTFVKSGQVSVTIHTTDAGLQKSSNPGDPTLGPDSDVTLHGTIS